MVVVEHDEDTIRAADFIIDLGPGAGPRGGQIVASGSIHEIERNPESLTGQYLSGALRIPIPALVFYQRVFFTTAIAFLNPALRVGSPSSAPKKIICGI